MAWVELRLVDVTAHVGDLINTGAQMQNEECDELEQFGFDECQPMERNPEKRFEMPATSYLVTVVDSSSNW